MQVQLVDEESWEAKNPDSTSSGVIIRRSAGARGDICYGEPLRHMGADDSGHGRGGVDLHDNR